VRSGEVVNILSPGQTKVKMQGLALGLSKKTVSIALFGHNHFVKAGDFVARHFILPQVPTGKKLLGRVIDSLGYAIDGFKPIIKKN